jgi:4-alpha-glucanotransferase
LPHRLTPNRVIYTGTHDNDTTLGWWESCEEHERRNAEAYLGDSNSEINWALIRAAQASVASLSVIPLQDVLSLGSEARMNIPSQPEGNWRWRYQPGALSSKIRERLALLAEVTDRLPHKCPTVEHHDWAA